MPSSNTYGYTGSLQSFTVPTSGFYDIAVDGGQGGASDSGNVGGLGAQIGGDFYLTAGQVLDIVVGQQGSAATGTGGGGGGGGGSFVFFPASGSSSASPLIVAGGGGGGGDASASPGQPGQAGESGGGAYGGSKGIGGGSAAIASDVVVGGMIVIDANTDSSGSGGGFDAGYAAGNYPGDAFAYGDGSPGDAATQTAAGGGEVNSTGGSGGYGGGGGGGGDPQQDGSGGGGGGYSGGGGNDTGGPGGGGGAFNVSVAEDPDRFDYPGGAPQGNGSVTITKLTGTLPTVFTASNAAGVNSAIQTVDATATAGNTYTIRLTQGITLDQTLDAIDIPTGAQLIIDGSNGELDGGGQYGGLFVYRGAVTVENLAIDDTSVVGGTGSAGGAGLGGGLFIASGGSVTLDNVTFADDSAVGGNANNEEGGGGLDGGAGVAGGGGIGPSATGSSFSSTASAAGPGIVLGAASGGAAENGPQLGGPDGGGGATTPVPADGASGGGIGGAIASGAAGGAGGFGGGGGSSADSATVGGIGGFGGGGGVGAQGGFGGGGGASEVGSSTPGGFGAGSGTTMGGGGLGAGGAIFVQQGGTLTYTGGSTAGDSVAGGASPVSTQDGSGFGAGLFLQGNEQVTLGASPGSPLTINDVIADQTGSYLAQGKTAPTGTSADGTPYAGAGSVAIQGAGGTVTLAGANTYSGGTTIESGTLHIGANGSAGSGAITFGSAESDLVYDPALTGGAFANTLAGLEIGNTIDLTGLGYVAGAYATPDGTALTLYDGTTTESFTLAAPLAAGESVQAGLDSGTGTLLAVTEEPTCFVEGTRLATEHGWVAVEHLQPGDLVRTVSGALRPVTWTGHRTVDCALAINPSVVLPVRIASHAFGPGRPERDLYLSRAHAIGVAGVLIPVCALLNGATVAQVDRERVTYWHVELDSHDLLLAEGLEAESYLDTGNRSFFLEADAVSLDARPDPDLDEAARAQLPFCRPFHEGGPLVDAVRRRLHSRAEALGWRVGRFDYDSLHLLVDGQAVTGSTRGNVLRFHVPAGRGDLMLVVDTFRPCDVTASSDSRDLGLDLHRLTFFDGFGAPHHISADHSLLRLGFHDVEEGNRRWTGRRAVIPAELFGERGTDGFLCLEFGGDPPPRWHAPPSAQMSYAAGS